MYIAANSTIHQAFFSDFKSMVEKEFEYNDYSFSLELYVSDFMHEQGIKYPTIITNCSAAQHYVIFIESLKKCIDRDGIAIVTASFFDDSNAVFIVVADD